MNAEQRQTATDRWTWTKPTDLSHWPACRQLRNYMHHRHHYYSLLSPKGDTHFSIPQRVESRKKDLDDWLYTQTVYLPRAVTHPSSNRAQCRLTMLIKANALTTTLRRSILM